jgi:enoyl-CoA hydratase/carnithine racemase
VSEAGGAEEAAGAPRLAIDAHGVATITLARPAQRNRLERADLDVIEAHAAALAAPGAARVVVLRGEGPVFCAGFNLEELQLGGREDPARFARMVDAVAALPLPTVARLHGGVFGGAIDLALACDFRVGGDDLVARLPAARLGLHYDTSGLERAVAVLGVQGARRLFLLAETMAAPDALAIGLLSTCVPAEALDEAVAAHVRALLAGAPLALAGMKASLAEIALARLDRPAARRRIEACLDSRDLAEGIAAARERRPARFTGA